MELTLAGLRAKWPREVTQRGYMGSALTGTMPISLLNLFEDEIREIRKEHNLRVIYRGPRLGGDNTKRENATGFKLYYR